MRIGLLAAIIILLWVCRLVFMSSSDACPPLDRFVDFVEVNRGCVVHRDGVWMSRGEWLALQREVEELGASVYSE
jgi:hypothetical protein